MSTDAHMIEQLLEYTFQDRSLLVRALTHPSYVNESGGSKGGDYQRLEFLGDAVLGMLLAELLFTRYQDWDEGDLSQLRSRLAGQDVLADRARTLGIGGFILLGRGEVHSSGREKDSILSDVLESLIAALYLDGGLQAARDLVARLFSGLADDPDSLELARDSKSALQEYLSLHDFPPPEYELTEESGPPHDRLFSYRIMLGERQIGTGQGKSKKIAQQAAAADALKIIQVSGGRNR